MAYRLDDPSSVPQEIQRVVIECIDSARRELKRKGADQHEGIHEARKRFKEIRAILRLVRNQLGDTYAMENAWFRDVARSLSQVRDAQAMLEAYDKLHIRFDAQMQAQGIPEFRTVLEQRLDAISTGDQDLSVKTGNLRRVLLQASTRVSAWTFSSAGFDTLASGLERIYGRGRRGYQSAFEQPTAEQFHEWRKRVKDQWYHTKLLKKVWSDHMSQRQAGLKHLSDLLGDDHDLAVLRLVVLQHENEFVREGAMHQMLGLIGRRQAELRSHAEILGRRLFADSPECFVRRMESFWIAWIQEREYGLEGMVASS